MLLGRSNPAVFLSTALQGQRKAYSEHRTQVATRVRVRATVRVQTLPSSLDGVSQLKVDATLFLQGPRARLLFRSGTPGSPLPRSAPAVTDCPLLPPGSALPIMNRMIPIRRDLVPLVWVSFHDSRRRVLSSPICAGHPQRESLFLDPVFDVPAVATTWLTARRLDRRGPVLGLDSEMTLSDGIFMRVLLASSCSILGTPGEGSEATDLEVAAPGAMIDCPSQTVTPEVRGFPLVSMLFRDWSGSDAGSELTVGWFTRLK
jgi:hypothetical protein